jgi:hypothetical protein
MGVEYAVNIIPECPIVNFVDSLNRALIHLTHLNQIRQVLGALQPEGLRDSSRWSQTTGKHVYECPHPERVPELLNGSG